MLHQIFILNNNFRKHFKEYNFHKLYRELLNFCSLDLSAFYFDIRKDILYCDETKSIKRMACIKLLHLILDVLLKWYAPVLSFTTEEITELAKKNKKASIHEEIFPEVPGNWKNDTLYKKWEKLLSIRQQVNIAIEEKRSSKVIGSSLEADVEISLSKQDFDILKGIDAEELFITSHVKQNILKGIKNKLEKVVAAPRVQSLLCRSISKSLTAS